MASCTCWWAACPWSAPANWWRASAQGKPFALPFSKPGSQTERCGLATAAYELLFARSISDVGEQTEDRAGSGCVDSRQVRKLKSPVRQDRWESHCRK